VTTFSWDEPSSTAARISSLEEKGQSTLMRSAPAFKLGSDATPETVGTVHSITRPWVLEFRSVPPVLGDAFGADDGREPFQPSFLESPLGGETTSSMEATSLTVVIPFRRQRRSRSAALNAAWLRLGTGGSREPVAN